jgi:nucleoid-associated protein YgaU
MRRTFMVFSAFLVVTSATAAWSKSHGSPRYEPPVFEELPGTGLPEGASTTAAPEAPAAPVTPSVEMPAAETPATDTMAPTVQVPAVEAPAAVSAAPVPDVVPVPEAQAPQAEAPVAQKPHKPYKVWIWQENGDCLWRIAEKVYGDRHKWKLIYMANRDIIKDPNKIYPKQRLKIPPPDWQP